jgi:hypothetical protein
MGREQLDRTKRFTDDGKLRGIISSAKFVPESSVDEEYTGFGQLFKPKGIKDEQVERELDIIEGERVDKRRRISETPRDNSSKKLDDVNSNSTISLEGTKKRKLSEIVILIPPKRFEESTASNKKRRRVQFADV